VRRLGGRLPCGRAQHGHVLRGTAPLGVLAALAALGAFVAAAAAPAPAGATAPQAARARVAVVVVTRVDLVRAQERGAVGLLVPGAGSTVTRAGALSSLVRGEVVSSLVGGRASGPPLIRLARRPAVVTIYVVLPPAGRSHNTRRYPIAIVGGGYRGVLVTRSTRVPGLVSIADVAPTAVALSGGRQARISWRSETRPAAVLERLDRRLRQAHDGRTGATIVLVAATLGLAALALLLRSPLLARSALLAIPAALVAALAVSGAGGARPGIATAVLAVATIVLALAAAVRASLLLPALAFLLLAELVVLAAWPEVNALAVIGPHPDGGGRYYGVTNQVETLLLVPVLAAGALAPAPALLPLGSLAVVLVGWSRAGADGGGVLVVLVGLVALWALRSRIRLTPARGVLAAAGLVALALALVGIDAATGGSSHVTHAVGSGPGSLAGDLAHRLRISWKGVTATAQAAGAAASTLVVLAGAAVLRPRVAVVDALLLSLAVSLLVNDTPTDVLAFGALGATALRVWAALDVPARQRSAGVLSPRATPAPTWR
jgi:hypothetical protein